MGKNRIIVIDDDRDMCAIVKERLQANGYVVDVAYDGVDGLAKIKVDRPDLILLDIKMARMDGFTMLHSLKGNTQEWDIPVVMITAHEAMKDLFEVEGVVDYIIKPFDAQDLLLRVARAIKK